MQVYIYLPTFCKAKELSLFKTFTNIKKIKKLFVNTYILNKTQTKFVKIKTSYNLVYLQVY